MLSQRRQRRARATTDESKSWLENVSHLLDLSRSHTRHIWMRRFESFALLPVDLSDLCAAGICCKKLTTTSHFSVPFLLCLPGALLNKFPGM